MRKSKKALAFTLACVLSVGGVFGGVSPIDGRAAATQGKVQILKGEGEDIASLSAVSSPEGIDAVESGSLETSEPDDGTTIATDGSIAPTEETNAPELGGGEAPEADPVDIESTIGPDGTDATGAPDHSEDAEVTGSPSAAEGTEVTDSPAVAEGTEVTGTPDAAESTEVTDSPEGSANTEVTGAPADSVEPGETASPEESAGAEVQGPPLESADTGIVEVPDAATESAITSSPSISVEPVDVSDSPLPVQPVETATPSGVSTTPSVSASPVVTVEIPTAGAVHAVGDKFTVSNFQYKITLLPTETAKGQVKLVGLSEEAKTKKTLTVGATVSEGGSSYQITGIGTKAFKTSGALTTVTIGKNVTFVGIRAFQGVTTLTTVYMGAKVDTIKRRAFAGCSSLRRIVLPSKVAKIKKYAFANCRSLKAVVITSKVLTEVGTKAFANNQSGRYFVILSGKNTKYKSLFTASGVKSVKTYTF